MGIFSRLSDIINSNLTVALDRAEDPEKMIRLMIQEMEETLVEIRSSAARVIADRKGAERRLARHDEAQGEWQRKAELALSKGREDLAKGALIEKTKLFDAARGLREELVHLADGLSKYEEDIAKLEAKLLEAKSKRKLIEARHQNVASRLKVRQTVHDARIEEAFRRFANMEQRLDRAEGEVEAFDLGRGKSLAEEITELEAEGAIEKELEALKARVAGGSTADRS